MEIAKNMLFVIKIILEIAWGAFVLKVEEITDKIALPLMVLLLIFSFMSW